LALNYLPPIEYVKQEVYQNYINDAVVLLLGTGQILV